MNAKASTNRITIRSIVLGIVFSALFAGLTVYLTNACRLPMTYHRGGCGQH